MHIYRPGVVASGRGEEDPLLPELMYLNGSVVSPGEAKVPVLDRGFLFGDGLYEVVRVYDNEPFCFEEHMDRFFFGVRGIDMPLPYTRDEFTHIVRDFLRQADLGGASLYWQVTRGAYSRRTHHYSEEMVQPTVFMHVTPLGPQPEEPRRVGTGAPLVQDIRWLKCCYKTVNLLPNCLAMTVSNREGAEEPVLYRDETHVTECAGSSFFVVKNGEIWTHPEGDLILSGITRLVIRRLCAQHGIPFVERVFGVKDLLSADEAFWSNTVLEIVPVVSVARTPIGSGKPGPVTEKVMDLFLKHTGQK
ncbi:MAG: aminotransferase class IV [Bacillota bacterium]